MTLLETAFWVRPEWRVYGWGMGVVGDKAGAVSGHQTLKDIM